MERSLKPSRKGIPPSLCVGVEQVGTDLEEGSLRVQAGLYHLLAVCS